MDGMKDKIGYDDGGGGEDVVKNVIMVEMMMMMVMMEKTMLAIPICCQCIAMSRSTEQLLALSLGKL